MITSPAANSFRELAALSYTHIFLRNASEGIQIGRLRLVHCTPGVPFEPGRDAAYSLFGFGRCGHLRAGLFVAISSSKVLGAESSRDGVELNPPSIRLLSVWSATRK
jgi:hypothetical protein